jgi:hypothetical protein
LPSGKFKTEVLKMVQIPIYRIGNGAVMWLNQIAVHRQEVAIGVLELLILACRGRVLVMPFKSYRLLQTDRHFFFLVGGFHGIIFHPIPVLLDFILAKSVMELLPIKRGPPLPPLRGHN